MKIRVSTDRLRLAAEDALKRIDTVDNHFKNVEAIVSESSHFWEGSGQEAYYHSYISKKELIDSAVNSFRCNIRALQTIAGIYETTESEIGETVQPLKSDVII